MATKKQDVLEAIDRRHRATVVIEQIGQSVRTLMVVGAVCFVAWCGNLIVEQLAGRAMDANIVLQLFGNLQLSVSLAWGAAALPVPL